ncbi:MULTISPECIES: carbon-phosphorus lyase complex subunit PhnI [unclassified Paenibacillus]|uniref:Carbon-phosphorus lyase complex subunit PhnI n=1 Tax=Paenibacillus provencensis TaxID=441151 RepID=A0ABW3PUC9_9BACL|nr:MULTISPECIES: carbon-phosphorus lyase complex subunit PhnI [unclassified Paenibacillus]MCM3127800.1 carbon-phosphorus lyase complex subunit PhnI [Paenibacillus sp. MER 78]SFS37758.1 alpha-D-ribose 1-methylphosphonate 5-triphosphate synthase subunit PhnI [Paenibacillus sp. 453mf]
MGYVAVKGGTKAIEESLRRLQYERVKREQTLSTSHIEAGMRGLIDQVMSESSMYSESLAALAIKQAEGNPEEAVFLLRAYRSTLPRKAYSQVVTSDQMRVERRISASFKDIPGGQILGATTDYSHRLLDFELREETETDIREWLAAYSKQDDADGDAVGASKNMESGALPKVLDYLRREGLIPECPLDHTEPDDVTRTSLAFPASRSEKLQILSRGQTGAVTSLAYAVIRGYGMVHPTVGELRVGYLPVYVNSPFESDGDEEDAYYIGDIQVTEVEMLVPSTVDKEHGKKELEFDFGYGLCYGQNETKAIAMSILDKSLEAGDKSIPTQNEEFVLYHIDSVESTGFISHLKMPHYVTFQSKLNDVRKIRKAAEPSAAEENQYA